MLILSGFLACKWGQESQSPGGLVSTQQTMAIPPRQHGVTVDAESLEDVKFSHCESHRGDRVAFKSCSSGSDMRGAAHLWESEVFL